MALTVAALGVEVLLLTVEDDADFALLVRALLVLAVAGFAAVLLLVLAFAAVDLAAVDDAVAAVVDGFDADEAVELSSTGFS